EAAFALETQGADVTAWPVAGDLDVSGRLDVLRVGIQGRHAQIDQVGVDGRLSADLIRVRHIGWRWRGGVMQLDGAVRHRCDQSRELSLRAKGDVPLGALAQAVGLDEPIDGKAEIVADVTGAVEAPAIAARVQIPELRVAGITAQQVSIDGQWADQKLR